MKLSEIKTYHCTAVARCYTTRYYAYRTCKVVRSKTKGFYKFLLTDKSQGPYPYLGTSQPIYAQASYKVNKNYTASDIKRLAKLQAKNNEDRQRFRDQG